jgi:hypothetical protein
MIFKRAIALLITAEMAITPTDTMPTTGVRGEVSEMVASKMIHTAVMNGIMVMNKPAITSAL